MKEQAYCRRVGEALLDPEADRPAAMDEHLASCPACREVQRAADRARSLGSTTEEKGGPPELDVAGVLGVVRRRRRRRIAVGGTLAAAAAALLVLALRPAAPPVIAPPRTPAVAALNAEAEEPATGASVFDLMAEIDGYLRRDVARSDETYAAFGAVASWVSPAKGLTYDAPLSGRAALDITLDKEVAQ